MEAMNPIRSSSGPASESYVRHETTVDTNMKKEVSSSIKGVNSVQELKRVEVQGHQVSVSEEQLIKAIEKAVKAVQGPHTFLEFNVHEATKRISIKVHNQETGEVIREIPPEKTLDFVAKLWEMAGILIDEKR